MADAAMIPDPDCPFCTTADSSGHERRLLENNSHSFAIRDAYRLTDRDTPAITNSHSPSFFDLAGEERDALMALPDQVKQGVKKMVFGLYKTSVQCKKVVKMQDLTPCVFDPMRLVENCAHK